MVRRNTGPKRRHQQHVRDFLLEILGQARRAKNIDLKGQVWPMLLHGAHRNHGDYLFPVELFNFGPVQFSEFHVHHSRGNRSEIVSKSAMAIASQAKAIELRLTPSVYVRWRLSLRRERIP
jgi:hypothetical protein